MITPVFSLAALVAEPGLPLTEGLARGIHAVSRMHVYSCDLTSETTPCAAVGILRVGPETVDTLALSDCVIVVDTDAGPQITCDLAIEELAGTKPAALQGLHIGSAEHQPPATRRRPTTR